MPVTGSLYLYLYLYLYHICHHRLNCHVNAASGPRRSSERYISDKITILCNERMFNQAYICFTFNNTSNWVSIAQPVVTIIGAIGYNNYRAKGERVFAVAHVQLMSISYIKKHVRYRRPICSKFYTVQMCSTRL